MRSRYGALGVDVHKRGIEAFRDTAAGLYRHAFCEIHPDPDMPGYGYVHHADGAGSKSVQNYLNWAVTGDLGAFRGMANDAAGMNLGDVFAVGVPTSGSFVDYVAINRMHVPKGDVLRILAEDFTSIFEMLRGFGINIKFAGGETADLPDQVRTLDVSGAIHARYKLPDVITGEAVGPGDVIIGIASGGQAKYEGRPAGAIMSNGLTLARHCLMRPEFAERHPEIREPGKEYYGPFSPTDKVQGVVGTIGEEITRPTRIFAPVFKGVIEQFGDSVHGIVFNTGGGHTKCLRLGSGVRYVKDSLPEPPAIFRLVQEHGKVSWREMHTDFNMGVGAELYVDPGANSEVSDFVQEQFGIDSWRIGECARAIGPNKLRLETPYGNFNHRRDR